MTSADVPATPTQRTSGAGGSASHAVNVGQVERWVSTVGGGMLALYGLSLRSFGGIGLALLGGGLIYRGVSGQCSVYRKLGISTADQQESASPNHIHVEKAVTINLPPEEVYRFWRNFANLPQFMKHLESVTTSDERHSHWVAKAPAGTNVAWDAEIILDKPNELIAWRSLPGADVDNGGSVRFTSLPADRGTEVKVTLEYRPPAGVVGATVAKLFGEEPSQQIEGDLRRLKNMLEAHEIPTTEGQTSGRASQGDVMPKQNTAAQPTPAVEPEPLPATVPSSDHDKQQRKMASPEDVVQEASEESMDGSDAPAWTDRRLSSATPAPQASSATSKADPDPLPTTVPSADHDKQQRKMVEPEDVVQEASEESMDGSDPPAWTDRREGKVTKEVGS